MNAEAQGLSPPFGWHAATAARYRLTSSQSHANHPTHDQSALGPLSLPSHARLEEVEESGEVGNDAGDTLGQRVESVQPEHSIGVPSLEPTSHGRSDIGDNYDGATGVESVGSTKRLDALGPDSPEDQTTTLTISKQQSKLLKPVIPIVPNLPPSGLLSSAIILAIH